MNITASGGSRGAGKTGKEEARAGLGQKREDGGAEAGIEAVVETGSCSGQQPLLEQNP